MMNKIKTKGCKMYGAIEEMAEKRDVQEFVYDHGVLREVTEDEKKTGQINAFQSAREKNY